MSKRPAIDLALLTAEHAAPMHEAVQRTPVARTESPTPIKQAVKDSVKTEDLEPLQFKVNPLFRKKFRQRAMEADMKLNELLFAAFDAWEEKQGLK